MNERLNDQIAGILGDFQRGNLHISDAIKALRALEFARSVEGERQAEQRHDQQQPSRRAELLAVMAATIHTDLKRKIEYDTAIGIAVQIARDLLTAVEASEKEPK